MAITISAEPKLSRRKMWAPSSPGRKCTLCWQGKAGQGQTAIFDGPSATGAHPQRHESQIRLLPAPGIQKLCLFTPLPCSQACRDESRLPELIEKGLVRPQWCLSVPDYGEVMRNAEAECRGGHDKEVVNIRRGQDCISQLLFDWSGYSSTGGTH